MSTELLDRPRSRRRPSGSHLLTGLALTVAALWLLVFGFPVGVASGVLVDVPSAATAVPVDADGIQIAVSADGGCAVSWPSDGEPTRVPSVTELGRVIGASLRAHAAGTVWFATTPPAPSGSTI